MVEYSERRLSDVFGALSDPARRWIVRRLAQHPRSASDLAKPLRMTLQGVAKHLAVLEHAGIARSEKRGRRRVVSLDPGALHAASLWIDLYRSFWESKLDALAAHVAHPAASGQVSTPRPSEKPPSLPPSDPSMEHMP